VNGDFKPFLKDEDRMLTQAWTLPTEGSLTDAQRRAAMDNFLAYIKRHKITVDEVAHKIGDPKKTTIDDLRKGKYTTNSDTHIRKLNNWIEQHDRQANSQIDARFVATTRVAESILDAAKLAFNHQRIAVLCGPTGIGKTRCAEAVQERFVGSKYLRVAFGCHTPKGLLCALGSALDCRFSAAAYNNAIYTTQFERIVGKLKESSRMLIFDEAHKLTDDSLEVLRDIHDQTRVPMLLVATKDLKERIEHSADADHGQFYSRTILIIDLTEVEGDGDGKASSPLFTVDCIRKLYERTPIRLAPDAARYLKEIANDLGKGSLRKCEMLVPSAAAYSRKRQNLSSDDSVTISQQDLESAERVLKPSKYEQETIDARRRRAATA